jgi:hypothetical protein
MVNLRKQDRIGTQQDIIAKVNYSRKWDLGLRGTYLERFDQFEKRLGGGFTYRPNQSLSLEISYLLGHNNKILPTNQLGITSYVSYSPGLTPFLNYLDSSYSLTHVQTLSLGLEIEKISHLIIIPIISGGKSTFKTPANTKDLYSLGARITYYLENQLSFSLFSFKGREASQSIIGQNKKNVLVDTLSGGLSASYTFNSTFKTELTFDHTDYEQLKNEFHTTTLNLTWKF